MKIKPMHWILAGINMAMVIGFGWSFLLQLNYEFLIYVGVVLASLLLVGVSLRWIEYTPAMLWSLTVWAALHLAGGGVYIQDGRLYDMILIPLSDTLPILRYDQVVHIWGFGASTLVMYGLLRPSLRNDVNNTVSLCLILVMAGLGVGAVNEIVEFLVAALVPESGVGGYLNTMLDLCANLIGALCGATYIHFRYQTRDHYRS